MMTHISKWALPVLQILLAAAAAIVVSLWIEEASSAGIWGYPPIRLWEYAIRILSCFVASIVGIFLMKRGSILFIGTVVTFYVWFDWSRLSKYNVIDFGHPADWYPLSFPSGDFVWLTALCGTTVTGFVLGRLVGGALKSRLVRRIPQQVSQGSN